VLSEGAGVSVPSITVAPRPVHHQVAP
jgi:hypothetical protein